MERQELIAKLNNEYVLKRKRAEFFAEQNKQKALENKEYFKLELKERELVLDISKLAFQNKPTEQLENKLKQIDSAKHILLTQMGFNENSLVPQYACKLCNDTGHVKNEYCTCFKQAMNNLLMRESQINLNLLPNLAHYETAIFNESHKPQIVKILDLAKKLVANFPNSKIQTLIFSGATGVGKTYLSKVMAKEVIEKGFTAYYTTAFNLNSLMLKYHTTFNETKNTLLNTVLDSDLLIIDDLGTEPILKNVTKEYLLLVLSERIENNKNTIINTNLGPEHIIARYGERIFSRLMNKQNSILVNIDGVDLRLKKAL